MRRETIPLSAHCAAILHALRVGPCTTLELQRSIGMTCVSTRIHELRAVGHPIDTRLIEVRNRHGARCHVAQYSLARRHRGAHVVRDSGRRAAKRRA